MLLQWVEKLLFLSSFLNFVVSCRGANRVNVCCYTLRDRFLLPEIHGNMPQTRFCCLQECCRTEWQGRGRFIIIRRLYGGIIEGIKLLQPVFYPEYHVRNYHIAMGMIYVVTGVKTFPVFSRKQNCSVRGGAYMSVVNGKLPVCGYWSLTDVRNLI